MRTYVYFNGVPGVWFFSLDAVNSLAVWGARAFYHLPYFNAEMKLVQKANRIDYSSVRQDSMTYGKFFAADRAGYAANFDPDRFQLLPRAELDIRWSIGQALRESVPGSLEFFLTERYCLYSFHRNQIYRSRILHEPWPLQSATVDSLRSTMIESLGIPQPHGQPLLHYAESIAVDIWPLRKVSEP